MQYRDLYCMVLPQKKKRAKEQGIFLCSLYKRIFCLLYHFFMNFTSKNVEFLNKIRVFLSKISLYTYLIII